MSSKPVAIGGASLTGTRDFWTRVSSLLDLKKPVSSELDYFTAVNKGISVKAVDTLKKEGLVAGEITLIIEPRTLSHRRAKHRLLSREESERAGRIGRIFALAESVFGDQAKALRWLRKPQKHFADHAPIAMLSQESGGRIVEEALIQIDEGYIA